MIKNVALGLVWLGLMGTTPQPALAGTLGQPIAERLPISASLVPAQSFPRPKATGQEQTRIRPAPTVRPHSSSYPAGMHLRPNIPHPAVVRVIAPEKGAISYGSGTLVDVRDQFGMVITNWHVVRDAQGDVEVLFPDGFRSKARALKVDSDWDLAALVIWRPNVPPVALATAAPRPGDQLTICGYGQGNYRAATGRCTQYYAPREDFPQHMVELDVEARQGDSGGPIFNQYGQLAGVLFGAGQGTTLGSFGGRVQSFLATLAPDIGRWADDPLLQAATAPPGSDFTNQGANRRTTNRESTQRSSPNQGPTAPPGHSMANAIAEGDRFQAVCPDPIWKSAEQPVEKPSRQRGDKGAIANHGHGAGPSDTAEKTTPWRALAGAGWYDQAKTVLAAIGLLAIVGGVLRAVR